MSIPSLDLSYLAPLFLNPSASLPYHLSLLPSFFRILAFLCILPVLLLAAVDIVGWAFFKILYRPLGYASTFVPSFSALLLK